MNELTREQVEEVFNVVYWHGDQQGAKQCKVLDGIDALRATITQQAQELENVKQGLDQKSVAMAAVIKAAAERQQQDACFMAMSGDQVEQFSRRNAQLEQQLAAMTTRFTETAKSFDEAIKREASALQQLTASQARCREMEREIESLTTCGCEGCDDNLEESAFCLPCMNKVQQQVTQLQATLAAREAALEQYEAERDSLKIIKQVRSVGYETVEELVDSFMEIVNGWHGLRNQHIDDQAKIDAAVQEAGRLREALRYYAQTAIGARAIAALEPQQAAGDSPAGQIPPNFREAP